jgi:GH15 family glucan-1,4-alpha-glucosidase
MPARSGLSESSLLQKSVEVILTNQSDNGAYIASPNFKNYRYAWLRDGAFIGYAMLLAEQSESARRFLEWTDAVIVRHRELMQHFRADATVSPPPTRFSLEGQAVHDDWPNHQIDGYGAWLWLLAEYVARTGQEQLVHKFRESIRLSIAYLAHSWSEPNFDCWEEFGDRVHTSTLACVYGGLSAINSYLGERGLHDLTEEIRTRILGMSTEGRFVKNSLDDNVDASLLWISTPFRVVDASDSLMRETVREIEAKLVVDRGVRRYVADTYYGGGRWLLLTAWLGWYYHEVGRSDNARELLEWVEAHAAPDGAMPEQVTDLVADPAQVRSWEQRWGPVATPLLWSHAMHIVLRRNVEARG